MAVSRVSAETAHATAWRKMGLTSDRLAGGFGLIHETLEEHVRRLADEGKPAGQQLVQHATDRVEITATVGRRPLRLLR